MKKLLIALMLLISSVSFSNFTPLGTPESKLFVNMGVEISKSNPNYASQNIPQNFEYIVTMFTVSYTINDIYPVKTVTFYVMTNGVYYFEEMDMNNVADMITYQSNNEYVAQVFSGTNPGKRDFYLGNNKFTIVGCFVSNLVKTPYMK